MANSATRSSRQVILRTKPSGVAFLFIDSGGQVNVLDSSMMRDLADALEEVAIDPDVQALAIVSGKPDSFCLGADLREIGRLSNKEDLSEMSSQGQAVLNRLANLSKPVVVGINGNCLGGGLELIMACSRRIATKDQSTIFALPEVKLGLIPGMGGTQRLPRLVGAEAAIDLILSGNELTANEALKIGLVDELVEADNLIPYVERAALKLVEEGAHHFVACQSNLKYVPGEGDKGIEKLFSIAQRSVRIKTKGQYPAPMRALEVMKAGLLNGMETGLMLEAQAFGELAASEISRNLRFVFFTSEFARKSAWQMADKLSNGEIKKVGVIGAGLMGMTIAQTIALSGFDVLLRATSVERAKEAIDAINFSMQKHGQKNSVTTPEVKSACSGIYPVNQLEEFSQADLIIEAVVENAKLKSDIFIELAEIVSPECIFATNTSSLLIEQIGNGMKGGERLIGLHFFHPVEKMKLVEVVSRKCTSADSLAKAMAFVSRLNKIPVAVADSSCFLVNRLLCCYLLQAAYLAEIGTPLNWIEDAALEFGMPMGPLALLDEVGLDVAFKVAHALQEAYSDRLALPSVIEKVEKLGLGGKNSGCGIYLWDETGKRISFNPSLIDGLGLVVTKDKLTATESERLSDCLILPMIDEAARCLEEKVVRRAKDIDLAMVTGIGFPAFRGGLLKFADSIGIEAVLSRLEKIYVQKCPPLEVSERLKLMKANGRRFYALSALAGE